MKLTYTGTKFVHTVSLFLDFVRSCAAIPADRYALFWDALENQGTIRGPHCGAKAHLKVPLPGERAQMERANHAGLRNGWGGWG